MPPIAHPSSSALIRMFFLALAIAVALAPVGAEAWGPFDGAYQLNLNFQGVQSVAYLIAVQDGPNIGVVFLALACPQQTIECLSPTWNYGFGSPTAVAGQYQGNTQAADGTVVGSFNLQFSGDSVVGTTTTNLVGESTASGTRFWGGNPAP